MSFIELNAIDLIKRQLEHSVLKDIKKRLVEQVEKDLRDTIKEFENNLDTTLARVSFEKIQHVKNHLELTDEFRVLVKINESLYVDGSKQTPLENE